MFLGTHHPKLDEKGRFFLPAKFREELAEGLVISPGQERCLTIWTLEAFKEFARSVSGPSTVKHVRDFQRMLAANASDEVPDKQGRITIPARLRDYAGLQGEIAVVGSFDRVEVWNPEAWERYQAEQEPAFVDMDNIPGQGS
ncbi:MAG: division/cell wall cluster transcriptional repressor MraZ [Propionibacteriaceae bacterium]|nr:division/cell wall cluster transcriptional repressor MraZ [Propionibacteriaceae bacterium]